MVFFQRGNRIRVEHPQGLAVLIAELDAGRRAAVAPGVDEQGSRGARGGPVGSGRRGQACQFRPIQFDAVDVFREVRILGARKANPALRLVDRMHLAHLPVALGHPAHERSVPGEEVEMFPAVALAGQKKRGVFQEVRITRIVDPGLRLFAKQRACPAVGKSGRG